jgi:hypothetical protein
MISESLKARGKYYIQNISLQIEKNRENFPESKNESQTTGNKTNSKQEIFFMRVPK